MPRIAFTPNLARHLDVSEIDATGTTVREALNAAFAQREQMRGYVLDDQDRLRKHVVVFVDGEAVQDRIHLSDAVNDSAEIFVMQALSGG